MKLQAQLRPLHFKLKLHHKYSSFHVHLLFYRNPVPDQLEVNWMDWHNFSIWIWTIFVSFHKLSKIYLHWIPNWYHYVYFVNLILFKLSGTTSGFKLNHADLAISNLAPLHELKRLCKNTQYVHLSALCRNFVSQVIQNKFHYASFKP